MSGVHCQFLGLLKEKCLADIILKIMPVILIYVLALEILNLKKSGFYIQTKTRFFLFFRYLKNYKEVLRL